MNKIVTVIVTHNRLPLLKEAISAITTQTLLPSHTIVVDNSSTDGTKEWLEQQSGLIIIHQPNSGGSGGFYSGIKAAMNLQADWIWVMDDDTICQRDTLEKLVDKLKNFNGDLGFIGSKCIWTDNSPHLMNLPAIKPSFNGRLPFNSFDHLNLFLIETCSFVSLLINAEAVKKVGLPYKEFFIWGDDQEYTKRITKLNYLGLYCADSIALHKTPINYFPDFYNDTPNNLWKHKYGFRNEFFMVKKQKGFLYFFLWLVMKLGYTTLRLIAIRSTDRIRFIAVLYSAAWNSIFFNPKIDRI